MEERKMGFVVFLAIVVGIIVIVVVAKKIKRNNTIAKAIEELKDSESYRVALEIRKALEEKGGDFGVWKPLLITSWKYDHQAEGIFYMFVPPNKEKYDLRIYFTEYKLTFEGYRDSCLKDKGCVLADDGGIIVDTRENTQEMRDYLRIASTVLIQNGSSLRVYIEGKLIEAT
jgi:hypothetical protein